MVESSLLTEEGMHADLLVCRDHIVEVSWCAGGAPLTLDSPRERARAFDVRLPVSLPGWSHVIDFPE